MSATTELSQRCHPACLVCGIGRSNGLALRFEQMTDGSVAACFDCRAEFQGYPDRLHGGVVAMLLDAAMTHCLFARHIAGLTAKLNIRYHRGVELDVPVLVRANIVDVAPPLYYLKAEIVQNDQVCASAKATFWDSATPENQGDLFGESEPLP